MALAANGGVASASSTFSSNYAVNGVNNGERSGAGWAVGSGGWNDATEDTYPDWVEIAFSGSRTINEVDVFTLQDNFHFPSPPTESLTFSLHGITAFDVQYWNGSAWINVPGGQITGNNRVWRKLTFSGISTSKIRVVVNKALAGYSRIVEIEAYSSSGAPAPNRTPPRLRRRALLQHRLQAYQPLANHSLRIRLSSRLPSAPPTAMFPSPAARALRRVVVPYISLRFPITENTRSSSKSMQQTPAQTLCILT